MKDAKDRRNLLRRIRRREIKLEAKIAAAGELTQAQRQDFNDRQAYLTRLRLFQQPRRFDMR